MIIIIINILNYLFQDNKKNILKIDKFEKNKNIELSKMINLLINKKIKKIWICNDYKKIIYKSKNNKINISKTEPIVINKIIDKCIDNNINFNFVKYIKSDLFGSIKKDIYFIYNKIIIPILYICITIYLLNICYYILIYFNNDNNNNYLSGIDDNFIGRNSFVNINEQKNLSIYLKKNIRKVNEFDITKQNISLNSWVGSPEVFEECFEVISYVKNISNYKRFNVNLPKGILLEGPPGVGKTLLAKAIASETDSMFIPVTGSEFVEVYVGVGASRVRKLFESARANKPSIIFIDEIDTIGKKRSNNFGGGSDEREQTLNQLLAEMDGFNDNDDILILAATNRKEILDKALLRPGRFDRIIKIGYPDKFSREKIINLYLNEKKYISKNINSSIISDLTDGFSGAELKNLINEAAILAARSGSKKIMLEHIMNAIEKNIVGLVKNIDTRNQETKFRISIHEIGHAFLVLYYAEYFDLTKISIKSTYNGAGGYTLYNDKPQYKNDGLYTKDILEKKLIIMMGGKAAESIWYGEQKVSFGSTQDLKQANQLARKMIGLFGMGNYLETFYNLDVDNENTLYGTSYSNKYSEKIKEIFDTEIINLISKSFIEAKKIIEENKIIFEELSILLTEKEILTSIEINEFLQIYKNNYFTPVK